MGVPKALATFRELKVLPKEFKTMTIQQLVDNTEKIRYLFTELRARMQPESPKLPYNKKARERELIQDLAQNYEIDVNEARAKVVIYTWPSEHEHDRFSSQIFNPIIEVAIAPRRTRQYGVSQIEIIGSINSVPGIDGGETYFQGGHYVWMDKDGYRREATDIRSILSECGVNSIGNAGWKKAPCVIFIDLITPCPEWLGSAGKTHINLVPYQDMISKIVSDLAHKMPSIRTNPGASFNSGGWSSVAERGEYKEYLEDFLKARKQAVEADPSLRIRDRLTQSGVWYRIRPRLIDAGFVPRKDWGTTRRSLTGDIKQTIEDLWPRHKRITREYLGIVAKARAVIYFRGREIPITADNVEELASIGTTELVVVEKEGITDVLLEHAAKYSIALVATAGKLVEYAKDLIESAHNNGINVSTLYDDDLSGREAPDVLKERGLEIPRLGIDKSTVKWLQENGYPELTEEKVLEEYTPERRYEWIYDEYLKTHRIELDSIVAAVGAEGLWKYITHRLEEIFPEPRDYTGVIDGPEPENYYPDEINELLDYLRNYTEIAYSDKWQRIKDEELAKVKGLLQTDDKKRKIDKELEDTVTENKAMKLIVSKIKELMESSGLPDIEDIKKRKEEDSSTNRHVDLE